MNLNGTWQLTYAEGRPRTVAEQFLGRQVLGRELIPTTVPEPVHAALERVGMIEPPEHGMNTLRCRWIEACAWIYRRTFHVSEKIDGKRSYLRFGCLDMDAQVYLNGIHVGAHCNAHRPAYIDVTEAITPGENLVVVVVDSGRDRIANLPRDTTRNRLVEVTKSGWLRRPQYQAGWDWSPHLFSIGILGPVDLTIRSAPIVRDLGVVTELSEDLDRGRVSFRVEMLGGSEAQDVTVTATLMGTNSTDQARPTVGPDDGRIELNLTVERPKLWWPWEHGEQHLYELVVTLETPDTSQRVERRIGLRRVELRQDEDGCGGRTFHVMVNRTPVFCKGANWVPPSLFPTAVSEQRCRELVRIACASNMNMLRVWGGGTWLPEAALRACDELGIMVWHDFLFACADYPGNNDEFLANVTEEVSWGVRARSIHPSLVVWCGNNEVEQTKPDRGAPGSNFHTLFLDTIPRIVSHEASHVPYWPASPHSRRGVHPNNPHCGDQHPWFVTLGSYNSVQVDGDRMDHHDNFHGLLTRPAGHGPGHAHEAVRYWLGRDSLSMGVEEYAVASMLIHARGLEEYIRNYRRRKFLTGAAIYWMLNDSWPTTHSWPTFANDLRKKLAFHPVRRAFAPVTVIVADDGDRIGVWGVSDLLEPWSGELRYGLVSCRGNYVIDESTPVELPANASTLVRSFSREEWVSAGEGTHIGFALLAREGEMVAQATLMLPLLKEIEFDYPTVETTLTGQTVTLEADRSAWGVCLDTDGERDLRDNCVDLLPRVPYSFAWPSGLGAPEIIAVGSRDIVHDRTR